MGMGLLPIPKALVDDTMWKALNEYLDKHRKASEEGVDLSTLAKEIPAEVLKELEEELIQALGITQEEYERISEYGKWLNETARTLEETAEAPEEE